ncbi:hypothetical protein M8494_11470 [Serratia ureilytica]
MNTLGSGIRHAGGSDLGANVAVGRREAPRLDRPNPPAAINGISAHRTSVYYFLNASGSLKHRRQPGMVDALFARDAGLVYSICALSACGIDYPLTDDTTLSGWASGRIFMCSNTWP